MLHKGGFLCGCDSLTSGDKVGMKGDSMDLFIMGWQDLSFAAQALSSTWGMFGRFLSLLKDLATSLQHFQKFMASQGATNWHSMHAGSAL